MLEKLEKLIDVWVTVGEQMLADRKGDGTATEPATKKKAAPRKKKAAAAPPAADPLGESAPVETPAIDAQDPLGGGGAAPAPEVDVEKESKALLKEVVTKYCKKLEGEEPNGEARLTYVLNNTFKLGRLADLPHEGRLKLAGMLKEKL